MDETTETPAADEARPWHGADSPMEALYQWFLGEIALVKAHVGMATAHVEAMKAAVIADAVAVEATLDLPATPAAPVVAPPAPIDVPAVEAASAEPAPSAQ